MATKLKEPPLSAAEYHMLNICFENGPTQFTTLGERKTAFHLRDLGYLKLYGDVGFYFELNSQGFSYLKTH